MSTHSLCGCRCPLEKFLRAYKLRTYGFLGSEAKSLFSGHEHPAEPGLERSSDPSDRLAAPAICHHVPPGPHEAAGSVGRATSRGRKPIGCLQATNPGKEKPTPMVHAGLPSSVDRAFEMFGKLAELRPHDAAHQQSPKRRTVCRTA